MADPIWLDSDVIMAVANGDTALEAELLQYSAGGQPLLRVPKVSEECRVGNPFKKNAIMPPGGSAANEQAIARLGVQEDTSAGRYTSDDRVGLTDRGYIDPKTGKPMGGGGPSESDSIVLSQVTASAAARGVRQPKIFSLDSGVRAHASKWGVTGLARRSTPTPQTGGGGAGGAPGGGGGLPPGVKTIQLGRTTPGRGDANASASFAVFQIIDTLANYLSAKYLAEDVKSQILIVTSQIRAHQQKNPSDGALVAITFSRVRPNDPTGVVKNTVAIHPGDTFQYINVYFDTTPEKAIVRLDAPAAWQDLGINGPYKLEWSVNRYWVNPVQPALDSPVGKWRVRVPPWLWIYEFDVKGGVRGTDPFNQETGKGSWKVKGDLVVLSWDPPSSTTKESWDFPMVPANATGRGVMTGRNFSLTAEKPPY